MSTIELELAPRNGRERLITSAVIFAFTFAQKFAILALLKAYRRRTSTLRNVTPEEVRVETERVLRLYGR